MKRTAVLLAAIAVVLAAAGCGAAKEISVGFIATNFSAEAQARVANSFEKLAKEKGWDVKMLNSAGSIETQSNQLENLYQMKVDAVVMAMAHPQEIRPALDKLVEAKIPVITIDSGYVDGVVADITADNFAMGAKASTFLMDTIGGQGNIIVIKFEKHYGTRRRGKVLDVVLTEYPGVKVLAEYSVVATKRFMDDTRAAMETYATRFGDQIDGVWCAFDQLAYVAGDVLQERGNKKAVIVGVDGNQETFRRIGAGQMAATVAQPFEAMAGKAIELVNSLAVEGKTVEEATGGRKIFYMDAPLIDRTNLPE
ncbi:MAG: sugar ABC transporter substrate-binding protein [Aminobacteriaceae bacterium]|jgi:ABC-type sugar transport system substrate-binding protein|uniref:sugar ABC transporter substrate-binding protein n=1 Tax=Aminivibrio sp. TaxID=1872489 RepID=UPI001B607611|nr:sugar ABC transporter substrate-binding protein [Aminivibrio sp.]MBP6333338.1 sugar ABC transporter substrate-binding protein [Aminivibrio sp.]MDD3516208.1 sugar ABC transporter substrate-binding protein [Synergistaceae bacterium]MEA4951262.1 sugar ABC transporter substrate-binding protein [Aminivibrio sp.]NCB15121.1 sugar ABC transporter substrate-binding protein [Synergistales bacterium]